MDIKLKDILGNIRTYQAVQFEFESGECVYLTYSDIFKYQDYYVTEARSNKDVLILTLKRQI